MKVFYEFPDLRKYLTELFSQIPTYEGTVEFFGNPLWIYLVGMNVRSYKWSNEIFIDNDGDSVILAEYTIVVNPESVKRLLGV